MNKFYSLVLLALLGASCSSSDSEKKVLVKDDSSNIPKEEVVVKEEKKESLKDILDEEAKQFLNDWLASQNNSDYEAYSALYATKFEGVKRVGSKAYHYNQKKWLKDRARMFRKKVTVEADDIKVLASPKVVIVQFTQTWASGSYKDVGPKQLVLFKEKDQLQIAKEEMMSSTILGKENADMVLKNRDKSFLFTKQGKYVVLAKVKNSKWGASDYELLNNYTVKQSVNEENVTEYQQWLNRELYTYGRTGEEGKAKVTGLYIISQAQPHWGMVGAYESGEVSKEAYTEDLVGMSADYAYLVAELDTDDVSYASVHPQTGLSVAGKEVKGEILQTELLSLLKKTDKYKDYQNDYSADYKGEWIESEDARISLTEFDFNSKKYVHGAIAVGHGCGDFYGAMSILWEVTNGDIKIVSIFNLSEDYLRTFKPDYMTDFDNDGEVELWDDEMLIKNDGKEWTDVEYIQIGYFSCPC